MRVTFHPEAHDEMIEQARATTKTNLKDSALISSMRLKRLLIEFSVRQFLEQLKEQVSGSDSYQVFLLRSFTKSNPIESTLPQ